VDYIIAALQKDPLERLWINVREYQGHSFGDIRWHFVSDDNDSIRARRA
jgi:hypothetical protein